MNLLDSSAWIELLVQGPHHRRFEAIARDRARLIVPSIVVFEVTRWARQKLGPAGAWASRALLAEGTQVPLDARIAESAAGQALAHRLATADAIIYGTALAEGATVHTMDHHFKGLPGVEYVSRES